MWTDNWIGKNFAEGARGPDHYDCLGLYLAVYQHRMGIVLPDPMCSPNEALETKLKFDDSLKQVDSVTEGDLALFKMGPDRLHIGYIVNKYNMLHIECKGTLSVIERHTSTKWQGRLIGTYRYV